MFQYLEKYSDCKILRVPSSSWTLSLAQKQGRCPILDEVRNNKQIWIWIKRLELCLATFKSYQRVKYNMITLTSHTTHKWTLTHANLDLDQKIGTLFEDTKIDQPVKCNSVTLTSHTTQSELKCTYLGNYVQWQFSDQVYVSKQLRFRDKLRSPILETTPTPRTNFDEAQEGNTTLKVTVVWFQPRQAPQWLQEPLFRCFWLRWGLWAMV